MSSDPEIVALALQYVLSFRSPLRVQNSAALHRFWQGYLLFSTQGKDQDGKRLSGAVRKANAYYWIQSA